MNQCGLTHHWKQKVFCFVNNMKNLPLSSVAILALFVFCVQCSDDNNINNDANLYVPSAPQNLTVRDVTSNELLLTWTIPAERLLIQTQNEISDQEIKIQPLTFDNKVQIPTTEPVNNIVETTNIFKDDHEHVVRGRREISLVHRHRKRQQDNETEIAKQKVHYVLYFEEGVPKDVLATVDEIPSSVQVKEMNFFNSDLNLKFGWQNITLEHPSGSASSVGVKYKLKGLKSFTPYKIWVRAYFQIQGPLYEESERLGPKSEAAFALTEVQAPSEPKLLNLSCQESPGEVYLQWQQPDRYDNSLDRYIITLRRLPEPHARTRMTIPTNKSDLDTAINIELEMTNVTEYEVRMCAATKSVVRKGAYINGSESEPQVIRASSCGPTTAARAPDSGNGSDLVLVATVLLAALASLTLLALYWRNRVSKCITAAYGYLETGSGEARDQPICKKQASQQATPVSSSITAAEAAQLTTNRSIIAPRMCGSTRPALTPRDFARHVARLHKDGDVGFSKEYEIVGSVSETLPHSSHHSQLPENRHKNRYLNITAYDHSRVSVSTGSGTEYVNANFIDGILGKLDNERKAYIRKKLNRTRKQHSRQPSNRSVSKANSELSAGIESAFLNIEFSGISDDVNEADEHGDDSSDDGDDTPDDIWIHLDGDRRRVKLEWLVWRGRYIATQGPTPHTTPAFWRMIWQHDVHAILMITNLVERGRRKCDMYWPNEGSVEYSGIRIQLLSEDVRASYTAREMLVTDGVTQRTITQYHYTLWPDHGTPAHPLALLPLARRASKHPAPLLVHCSAGVGRTGTYIVLDSQLAQLSLTGTLAPLGFLCRARAQRNYLVQTEEQYMFVHDALLEHVRSGNTEVDWSKSFEHLWRLLQPIGKEELEILDAAVSTENLTNGDMETHNDLLETNGASKRNSLIKDGSEDSEPLTNGICESTAKMNGLTNEDEESAQTNGSLEDTDHMYDLEPKSNDYAKRMAAFAKLSEADKEEIRRLNQSDNYAILCKMRQMSLKKQNSHVTSLPPPSNHLEKQYQLISRYFPSASVAARSPFNSAKNRPGGVLPSDNSRVMLIPRAGVEGSDYINASWVPGLRRVREFAVVQHPPPSQPTQQGPTGPVGHAPTRPVDDLWRMLWDHTAQIMVVLSDENDPECPPFYPTPEKPELLVDNYRVSLLKHQTYAARRKMKLEQSVDKCKENHASCIEKDEERLIPEDGSRTELLAQEDKKASFDRTELRLDILEPCTRRSIANGDIYLDSKRVKSPRSPSKMSLKSFKLGSPTKFKFPELSKPPTQETNSQPTGNFEPKDTEAEKCQPCYEFETVSEVPEDAAPETVIQVYDVSVHSLRDDYQLGVKIIKCDSWMKNSDIYQRINYTWNKMENNKFLNAISSAKSPLDASDALKEYTKPFGDTFALLEFVAGRQAEYRNAPVAVVDKYGGWRAWSLCALSTAAGAAPINEPHDLYGALALAAHCRAKNESPANMEADPLPVGILMAMYGALAEYSTLLAER